MILLAIAEHADEKTAIAWPSIARLSDYANVTERNVRVHIANLVKLGELGRIGRSRHGTNKFKVLLGRSNSSGGTESSPGRNRPLGEDGIITRTVIEPSISPLKGFDEFWNGYPKRVGRIAARNAYNSALKLPGVDHAKIMTGLARYQPDEGFECNPRTWLKEGRWDDDFKPTTPKPRDVSRRTAGGGSGRGGGSMAAAISDVLSKGKG